MILINLLFTVFELYYYYLLLKTTNNEKAKSLKFDQITNYSVLKLIKLTRQDKYCRIQIIDKLLKFKFLKRKGVDILDSRIENSIMKNKL